MGPSIFLLSLGRRKQIPVATTWCCAAITTPSANIYEEPTLNGFEQTPYENTLESELPLAQQIAQHEPELDEDSRSFRCFTFFGFPENKKLRAFLKHKHQFFLQVGKKVTFATFPLRIIFLSFGLLG